MNKKYLHYFSIWTLALLLLSGCKKDSNNDQKDPNSVVEFDYSGMFIRVPEQTASVSFGFLTKRDWTVRLNNPDLAPFLSISSGSGKGDGLVLLELVDKQNLPSVIKVIFTFRDPEGKQPSKQVEKYLIREQNIISQNRMQDSISIGKGIDACAAMDLNALKVPVFDINKLQLATTNMKWVDDYNVTTTIGKGASGTSTAAMSESWATSVNGSYNFSVLFGVMQPFGVSFDVSADQKISSRNCYEIKNTSLITGLQTWTMRSTVYEKLLDDAFMARYGSDSAVDNYLERQVLPFVDVAAMSAINEDRVNYSSIFATYGTHILTAAEYGGRYDYLYAREQVDHEAVFSTTAELGLTLNVPQKIIQQHAIGLNGGYSQKDSVALSYSTSVSVGKRVGGTSTAPSVEDWFGSLDSQPLKSLTITRVLYSQTDQGKGLLPIWALCLDPIKRAAMKDAWVEHLKKHAPKNVKYKKVLADIYISSEEKEQPLYREFEDHLGNKRLYKKAAYNLTEGFAVDKGYSYLYYAWGYADKDGFTEARIMANDDPNGLNPPYQQRGDHSIKLLNASAGNRENRVCIKGRDANTPSSDLVTGISWHDEKGNVKINIPNLSANWTHCKVTEFKGVNSDKNETYSKHSDFFYKCGLVHPEIYLYQTKDSIPH